MSIPTRCPECNKSYNLADHLLGKSVRCKQCAQPFTVKPARGAAVADEAVTQSPGPRAGRAPAAAPPEDDAPPRLPRRRQKSGSSVTLWLLLGGGGVLVVAGIVVTVILLSKGSPSSPDIP